MRSIAHILNFDISSIINPINHFSAGIADRNEFLSHLTLFFKFLFCIVNITRLRAHKYSMNFDNLLLTHLLKMILSLSPCLELPSKECNEIAVLSFMLPLHLESLPFFEDLYHKQIKSHQHICYQYHKQIIARVVTPL